MGVVWQDLRYACRMLLKNPGFTAMAILALGLGIGANTAIFSVVNTVLLRPLPYTDPDRLVHVFRTQPPITRGPISRPDFFVWQEQNKVFQAIAGYYNESYNLTGIDEADRVRGTRVTDDFFSLFGMAPLRGRFLLPSDNRPGSAHVAVMGEGLWKRHFGSDPNLVGKTITLNGEAYSVVGIVPGNFRFPSRTELWTPAVLAEDKRQRGNNYVSVIGRLKDDVTTAQAQAQMNQITASLAQQYPEEDTNLSVAISPLLAEQVRNVRAVLFILLGAVVFVLLIACANVANLLLARATARQREIAIRTALGASRWRIVRQLLTESIALALFGGALGVFISAWGISLLIALAPAGLPRIDEIGIDTRVLGFTLLISVLTGVIFGLVPAWQASRPDLNETLKEGSRGAATGSPRQAFVRRALVVAEVSLSLVLLISAGLLIRSIRQLTAVSPGFDAQNLLTANVSLPRKTAFQGSEKGIPGMDEMQSTAAFLAEARQQIAALPGVKAVGAINDLPLTGGTVNTDFNIEGRPTFKPGEAPVVEIRWVTPGYFQAIGVRQLSGRSFTDHDNWQAPTVVLINETMARRFFPGEDPLGKRLQTLAEKPNEIIGVVSDTRQESLGKPPDPEVYFSYAQMPGIGQDTSLVVRTTGDPGGLTETVRRAVQDVNRDAPIYSVKPMTQVLADSTAQQRFNTILMTIFAGVALVMAGIGLYGVISYSVAQRAHEIGIRMALGARSADVLRMVLWQGLKLALAGIAGGLIASLALTRVLANVLYDVSATDPIAFGGVSVLLGVIALLACYIPARRATKVDPMVALRYE